MQGIQNTNKMRKGRKEHICPLASKEDGKKSVWGKLAVKSVKFRDSNISTFEGLHV